MSKTLVRGALVALIGCADTESRPLGEAIRPTQAPSVEGALALCEPYREALIDAYGMCLKRAAVSLATPEEMDALCKHAGGWETECHSSWVDARHRLRHFDNETLLRACGPAADCALQRLDAEPDPDVLAQIGRCGKYAGVYTQDCVGHALQRWASAGPDATDIARVVAEPSWYEVQVGTFLGMIVACQGTTTCPEGEGRLATACRLGAQGYERNPSACNGPLPR